MFLFLKILRPEYQYRKNHTVSYKTILNVKVHESFYIVLGDITFEVPKKFVNIAACQKNKKPKLDIAGSKNIFWLKECGWEDQLRLHAKDVVREKGLERIKLEELTKEITPKVEKVKMSSEEFIKKFFLAILAHSSWLYICILADNLYYLQTKNIKKLNFILNMILNKLK